LLIVVIDMGRIAKIIVLLIIPFLFLNWENVVAQEEDDPILLFSGKIVNAANGKIAGVTVTFTQDGSLFETATTASSGKYPRVEAPYGHVYKVTFSKEGYVSKSVIIDAKKGFFVEDVGEKETNFDGMGTTLIKQQPNVDYSVITNRPVAKAHIDPSTGKLDFDFGYINTRKKEIDKFIADLANEDNKNEQKFLQLIKEGDKAIGSGQYTNAIAKYEEAIKIKADEDVDAKIADAENKLEELEELKKLDEEFNKVIKKGDQLLASNDFDGSIEEYNKAKGIKPGDKLPDEKIKAANDKRKLADSAALDKQYNDKMAEANIKFNSKEWSEAENLYKEALQIKPIERDPKDKIAEITAILKKQKELEEKYNNLVAKGDQAMTGEKYSEAISSFEEALSLKKDESYPKEQLAKAKDLKEKSDAAAGKQKAYDDLISKANGEFGSEKWEEAKSTYNEALGVLPNEQLPKDKIVEIDAKLKELADADAAKAAQQKKYDDLISKANGEYASDKLEDAKSTYNEALGVLPNEQLPKDKIAEIDARLKELADAEADKAAQQKKYDDLISKANDEFGSEKWEDAKSTYEKALGVFPNEKLPKDKISEIDAKLKELADAGAKKAKYDDLIAKANGEFGSESWETAKSTYEEALGVLPNEQLPKDKIAEIDGKLKELADANAENEAKQKKYDDLITKANGEYGKDELEQAVSTFKEALGVFPDEQLPKNKIAEIEGKIKALADAKEAQDAAEAEEKVRKDEFNELMASGNTQLQDGELDKAKNSFIEASKIFPNNNAPKDKLTEVNQKIKTQGEQNELDGKYNEIISRADAARDSESWEPAKQLYKEANTVKPGESYPQEQITWINDKMKSQLKDDLQKQYQKIIDVADKMFADENYSKATELYNRANGFAAADGYPSEKIAEIEKILADNAANSEKEKEYSYLIAQADNQFESENWIEAKDGYNKALAVIDKQYPKDQISKIEDKINEGKDKEEAYNQLILKADGEFAAEDWQNAKSNYEKALTLMPNDYPRKQIDIIQGKLKDLEASSALDKKYNDKIEQADAARDAKNWDPAKKLYKDANGIKPSESYPQEQIDWINDQMKTALEDEVNKQYQKIIDKADELFGAEEYEKSKGLYQRAKDMRPADSYPPKKIAEIIAIMDRLASENADAAAQKVIDDKYNAIIAQADNARDEKNWDPAKKLYKDANGVKPAESYPQEQINWINDQMKTDLDNEVNKQYQKIIDVADKLFGEEDYLKSKKLYQRANGMKPGDSYPPEQIRKIDAAMRADADKAQLNALYSSYIKEGNADFETETYRKSLKAFQNALGVKPDAPYPQKKIDEINAILDELAAKKVENKRNKPDEFLKNPYGEEVTGKYSEEDVKFIMTSGRIDDNNINDEIIRKRKEAEALKLQTNSDDQHTQGDKINEANEEMETRISEFTKDADIQRENNADNMVDYKDNSDEILNNRINLGRNVTYDNSEANENMETRIAEFNNESDNQRQDNVKSMEDYKHGDYTDHGDRIGFGTDRTYDNELANETMETRIADFSVDSDIQRQDNVKSMEDYKHGDYSDHGDRIGFGTDRTYDNELANETMETRIADFSVDSDIQRQDNVKSMEDYSQVNFEERGDRIGFGTDRTYDNEVANESMETRINEFSSESDIQRQDNVKSMEDYKHGDYTGHGDRIGFGTDRTYDNELANETMETRIAEFSVDSDDQRQDNVKSMGHYQEKEWAIQSIRGETSSDKNYNTFEEQEELLTQRNKDIVDADDPRERNADAVGKYEDDLKDMGSDYYNKDKDSGMENAEEMDRVKNQSPTMFVDENQQKLATQYPEGITEKMFERRNGRGDVIEVTILRIVISGLKGDEYKKVSTKWGTNYFKNGGIISEYIWDTETN